MENMFLNVVDFISYVHLKPFVISKEFIYLSLIGPNAKYYPFIKKPKYRILAIIRRSWIEAPLE